jgi:energy-converting hydrogenase Eha subunit B
VGGLHRERAAGLAVQVQLVSGAISCCPTASALTRLAPVRVEIMGSIIIRAD